MATVIVFIEALQKQIVVNACCADQLQESQSSDIVSMDNYASQDTAWQGLWFSWQCKHYMTAFLFSFVLFNFGLEYDLKN